MFTKYVLNKEDFLVALLGVGYLVIRDGWVFYEHLSWKYHCVWHFRETFNISLININFSSWLFHRVVACWETLLLGSCGFIEVKTLLKGYNLTPFSNFQHLCNIYHINLKKKYIFLNHTIPNVYSVSTIHHQDFNIAICPILSWLILYISDSTSLMLNLLPTFYNYRAENIYLYRLIKITKY